jgi:hypothetical protein
VLSARGIWANAGINFTENAISQSSTIDSVGKRTWKPVNVNGSNNWYLWTQWNKGEGEKKFNYNVGLNANGGRNISFVNDKMNQTDYYTTQLSFGIRYEVSEKYRFYLAPNVGYNSSKSSLNTSLNNNYYSYGGNVEGYVMLPWKLELSSECEFNLQQRINAFTGNPNIILWKADISKKVFKDKSGKIIFLANDLLDRNKGFNRTINSDRITEERYQRLSRYFMLKFEWFFNKMPGQK